MHQNINTGYIRLVDSMGDDQSIINAARVSYHGDGQLRPEWKDDKLIKYLLKNRHTSPFEHVTLTFEVKAPIFVVRQWMRHRTWSFNEISARYVKLDEDHYKPTFWRGQSEDNKQMSDGTIDDPELAHQFFDSLMDYAWVTYNQLVDLGVSREQARSVLPVGVNTRFYATVNLHNLLQFVRLRDHEHAQPEIGEYARAMVQMAETVAPRTISIWEDLDRP